MPITSCVGQQPLLFLTTAAILFLTTAAYLISYNSGLSVGHVNEFVFVLGMQINKQTFLEVFSAIRHQMKIYVFLQQGFVCDIRSTLISCFVLNSGSSVNAIKYA
jgi:hypothetical protein